MASEITMKKGEGKDIRFNITRDSSVIDLSSATFKFGVKADYDDTTYLIEKTDDDFDKTLASVGIVSVNISATDSDITEDHYISELKITITASTDVDKSITIPFEIQRAVIHD